ncbi:MAG: diguanylate cyclase [Gemmatimonadetes bacterium]|nr:diguanylate cyclase [Gemmatimonadota bacterium]
MTAAAKIVVADDDQALLHTLQYILRGKGYEVVTAASGENLVGLLEAERPDLLMLDIMMPKVDGLQLLDLIKQDSRWRDLPVLMVSSMPPEEATVQSLGLGAADFIPKPFRVGELVARVEARIRASRDIRRMRELAETKSEEARSRSEMVDILREVTDSLKPEEIYHILARRVARALGISKCSVVIAEAGDESGTVVAAYENPMLRNLQIQLRRYPEIRKALATHQTVLVPDVATDTLYSQVREEWARENIAVTTRSAIALPFQLRGQKSGVFFLRTTSEDPPLTDANAAFAASVIDAAVTALEKAHDLETAVSDKQRYEWLASTDALTGCVNRRALHEKLERELDRARRYNLVLTILMIDLDRFKEINDTRGHLVGDSVLRQVGELLRHEARSVDIVARYGGEEFVIALPDTALEGGLVFAERVRLRIGGHEFADRTEQLHATVSVGVAMFPDEGIDSADALISRADGALYRAKAGGRNRVVQ